MDLEKLVIKIMAETSDAQTKMKKIRDEATKTAQKADKSLSSIGRNTGLGKVAKQVKAIRDAVNSFGTRIKLGAGLIRPTEEFIKLSNAIINADARLDEFRKQLDALDKADPNFAKNYQELSTQISFWEDVVEGMNDALNNAVSNGSAFESTGKIKKFFDGIINGGKTAIGWLRKLKSGFGAVLQRIPLLGRGVNGAANSFGGLIKKMLGVGAAVWGVRQAIGMAKEGMANLAGYSNSAANTINGLKSSMLTLKNAFASAFYPILEIVAPVLSAVIDWCTAPATAIAQLISALTGKSVAIVARKASAGIGGVGSAANDAAGSVDKLNRSLMGFDQINKLDDNRSGGGGGGGGGGGAGGAGGMFDTVEIDSGIKSLADEIKEAWENADFTELGAKLGEKLLAGLEHIPWTEIQAVGAKVGKSIATGLNGFFGTEGLGESIGATIAQMLNTITITADAFAVNFEWDTFGKFIGDSINGFFDTYQFELTGKTISDFANGILTALIEAVGTVKWDNVGASVIEFLAGIKWKDIMLNSVELLGKIATAFFATLKGAAEEARNRLEPYFKEGKFWDDLTEIADKAMEVTVKIFSELKSTVLTFLFGTDEPTKDMWVKLILEDIPTLLKNAFDNSYKITKDIFLSYNAPAWLVKALDLLHATSPIGLNIHFAETIGDKFKEIYDWLNNNKEHNIVAKFVVSIAEGISNIIDWLTGKKTFAEAFRPEPVNVDVNGKVKTLDQKGLTTKDKTINNTKADVTWFGANGLKKDKRKLGGFKSEVTWFGANGLKKSKRTLGNFKSEVTWFGADGLKKDKRKLGNFKSEVNGFSADGLSARERWLSWFTAELLYQSDAIRNKTIGGFNATVSGVTFSQHALNQINRGLAVKANYQAGGGIYYGGSWHPVTAAAGGGSFDQGQLFVAREAGPEFVGTIGGHTAVMNNNQIVSSVAAGVYRAVVDAMAQSAGGRGTTVVLEGDAARFFKVMQREAKNYMNSTGLSPFPV